MQALLVLAQRRRRFLVLLLWCGYAYGYTWSMPRMSMCVQCSAVGTGSSHTLLQGYVHSRAVTVDLRQIWALKRPVVSCKAQPATLSILRRRNAAGVQQNDCAVHVHPHTAL